MEMAGNLLNSIDMHLMELGNVNGVKKNKFLKQEVYYINI